MPSLHFAVPVNSTAVRVGWGPPGKANGLIIAYQLLVSEGRSKRSVSPIVRRMNVSLTDVTVGGLSENTTYRVEMRAATVAGYGLPFIVNITTLIESQSMYCMCCNDCKQRLCCVVPSAPQSLSVSVIDSQSQSVHVTWLEPSSGSVRSYVVVYHPSGRPHLSETIPVQSSSVEISSLSPSTLYKFLVYVNDITNPPAVGFVWIPAVGKQ